MGSDELTVSDSKHIYLQRERGEEVVSLHQVCISRSHIHNSCGFEGFKVKKNPLFLSLVGFVLH